MIVDRLFTFLHHLDFGSCECIIFLKQTKNKAKTEKLGGLTKRFQDVKGILSSELETVIATTEEIKRILGQRCPKDHGGNCNNPGSTSLRPKWLCNFNSAKSQCSHVIWRAVI